MIGAKGLVSWSEDVLHSLPALVFVSHDPSQQKNLSHHLLILANIY